MPGYGDSWRSELYTWDGRLLSFLQTVARRRDLAGFVKRIHVLPQLLQASRESPEIKKGMLPAWDPSYSMPPGTTIEDLYPFSEVPPPAKPELRRSISKDEARGTLSEVADALKIENPERLSAKDLITLLIAALPKLEHCSLFFGPDFDMTAVHSATLSAAGISQLPLRTINISVLRIAERGLEFGCYVRALLEVSPYLESLNIHKCYGTRKHALPCLANLKHIRITSSRLSEHVLEGILDACKSLCSFTYEAGTRFIRDVPEEIWNCSDHFQLRNAAGHLNRHRKTLNSLHIDLRHRGGNPTTPSTFCFRELTALKHLFLNLDEFHSVFFMHRSGEDSQLLVRILPSSVASLHFAGRIGEDLPLLEKGLLGLSEAAVQGQFPSLNEVRWDRNAKLTVGVEDAVRTLLANVGIKFSYDSWPETSLSFGEGDFIPRANFENPAWALPDSDDFDSDL